MFLVCLRAPAPGALRTLLIVAAGLSPLAPVNAQPASASAPAAAASAVELTPAERAKRDAEKVFHWITIHGDKPRKPVVAVKEEKPPTVVRLKPPATVVAPATAPAATTVAAAPPPKPEVIAAVPAAPPAVADTAAPSAPAKASLSAPSAASITSAPPVVVEDDASDTLVPVTQSEPKFPINLVRTLRSGQVQVRFTVQTDGSVAEPVVVTSSNPRLNPAALAAVSQWRFAPVRKSQQGIVDLGFTAPE